MVPQGIYPQISRDETSVALAAAQWIELSEGADLQSHQPRVERLQSDIPGRVVPHYQPVQARSHLRTNNILLLFRLSLSIQELYSGRLAWGFSIGII